MCRLLGVVCAEPIIVSDAVGADVLDDFAALAKIHGDGWGIAGVEAPGQGPQVHVSAVSAVDDPAFMQIMRNQRGVASLVHLRWASAGLAVEPQNSHPFLADGLAMAHNGSIKSIGPLDALLEPDIVASLRGTTDSERYLGVIRARRRSTTTLVEAVRTAVAQLRNLYPEASLNALVLGEGQLVAVHANARSVLTTEDASEIAAADLPEEHLSDYFSMRWARTGAGALVVGSTGFGDLDWRPLPPESVTAISLNDLSMMSVPVMAD